MDVAPAINGRFPVKQMYDEEGNPFYPITLIDVVCGTEEQKRKLQSVGTTIRKIDLSEYMFIDFSGSIDLYILNDFIFVYVGHITNPVDMSPFEVDKEIVIARDIPPAYRSKVQIIPCSVMSGVSDRVTCWIDTMGRVVMRATPKYVLRDENYTMDYIPSVTSLDFSGLLVRTGLEDDIYNGKGVD